MAHPKAYDPQHGYQYQILCKHPQYNGREWEHCDYAPDRAEKNRLIAEYRLAYGGGYEFKSIQLPAKYWPKPDRTTKIEFHRLKRDINGNSRLMCHYSYLNTEAEKTAYPLNLSPIFLVRDNLLKRKKAAIARAHQIGGKAFPGKKIMDGGIVFQSTSAEQLEKAILSLVNGAE